jgi:hypothetical protein
MIVAIPVRQARFQLIRHHVALTCDRAPAQISDISDSDMVCSLKDVLRTVTRHRSRE